jgi:hypothetical protein
LLARQPTPDLALVSEVFALGSGVIRYPGGALGEYYHWFVLLFTCVH